MQVSDLLVEVRNSSYQRVGQITPDYLVGFNCVLRFNAIGTWTVTLPSNHPLQPALTTPGSGIIVSLNGVVLLSGPMTWVETKQTTEHPDGVTQITGLDDSVLLRDRLAYPTPSTADLSLQTSAYDVRTGAAEDVMKAYVRVNMGPDAPIDRQIIRLVTMADGSGGAVQLVTQGALGRGATVKASARFDILYELLQSLADASAQGGTPLGFDIRQQGTKLNFEVYQPTDRSATVRLDIANNRLTETTYSLGAPIATRAIVGGQGDGASRSFLERSSSASTAAESAWGRRIETFVDSRGSGDATAMQTDGDAKLATDGKAQITASVKPTDYQTMLFGTDWFLGDTVTVVVGSYELAAVVTELGLSVEEDGVRLYGTVGEPKLLTYESQILSRQQDLAARLSSLEKYK